MHKRIKQLNLWKIYQVSDYPNKFSVEFDGRICEEFRYLTDAETFCKGVKPPKTQINMTFVTGKEWGIVV